MLVSSLEAENVEWMFGIPGEENLDLLDSLAKSHRRQGGAKMKLVVTRHEQAAGFMAATVGRLTGHPAACLSTLGPGATNFSTALAYGFLGGFPMICITGQKPIRHSKQGAFQVPSVLTSNAAAQQGPFGLRAVRVLVNNFPSPFFVLKKRRPPTAVGPTALDLPVLPILAPLHCLPSLSLVRLCTCSRLAPLHHAPAGGSAPPVQFRTSIVSCLL